MTDRVRNVLFLCTGNSARSIIAECIVNRLGEGEFRGYSAGSHPQGEVNPYALRFLRQENYDVSGLRSKSWDEFAQPDAPVMDFVITVCGNAANETCPIWPSQPASAHWGLPDPAAVEGSDAEKLLAFSDTYQNMFLRIGVFVSLPSASLDKEALQKNLDVIGKLVISESAEAKS